MLSGTTGIPDRSRPRSGLLRFCWRPISTEISISTWSWLLTRTTSSPGSRTPTARAPSDRLRSSSPTWTGSATLRSRMSTGTGIGTSSPRWNTTARSRGSRTWAGGATVFRTSFTTRGATVRGRWPWRISTGTGTSISSPVRSGRTWSRGTRTRTDSEPPDRAGSSPIKPGACSRSALRISTGTGFVTCCGEPAGIGPGPTERSRGTGASTAWVRSARTRSSWRRPEARPRWSPPTSITTEIWTSSRRAPGICSWTFATWGGSRTSGARGDSVPNASSPRISSARAWSTPRTSTATATSMSSPPRCRETRSPGSNTAHTPPPRGSGTAGREPTSTPTPSSPASSSAAPSRAQ